MSDTKEMTDFGPVRRLRDCLVSNIHSNFTASADMYLGQGLISQDERIMLSGQISKALNAFNDGLPEELANRPVDQPNAIPIATPPIGAVSYLKGVVNKTMDAISWFLESKEFDTSAWNGSASQWDTPEAYCSDCLIDENSGGGPKTKDKCHLPYRKPGSSQINKNALRAIGAGARSLTAVQASPASKKKAANWVISHWKSAFGTPAPSAMYRIAGKTQPSAGEKSSAQFFKAANGDWYALLIYSNKYEDRETDILSNKAHVEYATWVNEKGFHPHITLFHQPVLDKRLWIKAFELYGDNIPKLNEIVSKMYRESGIGLAEVERVTVMNGFTFMLGKVYPEKVAVAEKLSTMKDLGTSHSFVAIDFSTREKSGMIVNKYRTFEGTILPRHRAANLLTLSVLQEKAMGVQIKMNEADRAWLSGVLGEKTVEGLETATADLEKQFDGLLNFKALAEGEEETPAEVPAVEPPVVVETPVEEVTTEEKAAKMPAGKKPAGKMPMDPEDMTDQGADEDTEDADGKKRAPVKEVTEEVPASAQAIAAAVMKMLNVEELQGVLKTLAEGQTALTEKVSKLEGVAATVEQLKKSDDEKIAEVFTPFAWKAFMPSQAEPPVNQKALKTQVEKEAPIAPDATLTRDPSNPLQVGFWDMLHKPSVGNQG
jgi:hypothetical protein